MMEQFFPAGDRAVEQAAQRGCKTSLEAIKSFWLWSWAPCSRRPCLSTRVTRGAQRSLPTSVLLWFGDQPGVLVGPGFSRGSETGFGLLFLSLLLLPPEERVANPCG